MKNTRTLRRLTEGAMIAAIYAVLTFLLWQFSSLQIQVRVSEALCILPLFTPSAVPGLTLGCLIANLLGGNNLWDMIFGSLATLLAATVTYCIGKWKGKWVKWIAPLPSVVFNALIIPFVLYFGYGFTSFGDIEGMWIVLGLDALSVAIGQIIACYGLGLPLYAMLKRIRIFPEKE
ncbi:MAG: QueT transporter family protein [Oscillospiraceae bacterium]|nr:QueT transporter family protein [Oscillospiraceae bacterium]